MKGDLQQPDYLCYLIRFKLVEDVQDWSFSLKLCIEGGVVCNLTFELCSKEQFSKSPFGIIQNLKLPVKCT